MSLVTRSPALLTGGRGFFSPPSSKPRLTAQNVGHLHRSPRSATVECPIAKPRLGEAETGSLHSVRGGRGPLPSHDRQPNSPAKSAPL